MSTRIQIVSDIHLEFHSAESAKRFVQEMDPSGVDVLVLAGDVANTRTLTKALFDICERYAASTVVFVHGNHELYGGTPGIVETLLRHATAKLPNLRVLDDQITEVGGVVFAGTPLWFRDDPLNVPLEAHLNDFHQISGFKPWVYERNRRAEAFLRDALSVETGPRAVDVVVTHHLPSDACVSPKYRGDTLNRFFVAPIADELPRLPQVWLYGHTHDAGDAEHRGCRFVCNPHGYITERRCAGYVPKLVLEVEHREATPAE